MGNSRAELTGEIQIDPLLRTMLDNHGMQRIIKYSLISISMGLCVNSSGNNKANSTKAMGYKPKTISSLFSSCVNIFFKNDDIDRDDPDEPSTHYVNFDSASILINVMVTKFLTS